MQPHSQTCRQANGPEQNDRGESMQYLHPGIKGEVGRARRNLILDVAVITVNETAMGGEHRQRADTNDPSIIAAAARNVASRTRPARRSKWDNR